MRQSRPDGDGSAASISRERSGGDLSGRDWHGNVRELRNAIEHALILAQGGVILPEHLPPPMPPLVSTDAPKALVDALRGVPAASRSGSISSANSSRPGPSERLRAGASRRALYDEFLALVEPPFLEAAMKKHHGQCAAAARVLGIHRTTLGRSSTSTASPARSDMSTNRSGQIRNCPAGRLAYAAIASIRTRVYICRWPVRRRIVLAAANLLDVDLVAHFLRPALRP